MPKISQRKWKKVKEKMISAVSGIELKDHEKEYWNWLCHWWIVRFSNYINRNR